MRMTEEQYLAYVQRGQPPVIPEKALQAAVIRLARQAGYLVYFTWSSKRSPEGFPDLVCAKAGAPLLCLELKTATGHITLPQQAWLDALAQCTGVHAQVVRPADLAALVARLREAP
jgi:hypothetical protein